MCVCACACVYVRDSVQLVVYFEVSVHFKASKEHLDVMQPQLIATTFFRPCVKLVFWVKSEQVELSRL